MLLALWSNTPKASSPYCLYNSTASASYHYSLCTITPQVGKSNAEEKSMKCSIEGCPGEYEQREVVHTVRQGERIIVIDHVPAEVCTICGDTLFTPETVRKLEILRDTFEPPIRTVPLYDFTQAKSA